MLVFHYLYLYFIYIGCSLIQIAQLFSRQILFFTRDPLHHQNVQTGGVLSSSSEGRPPLAIYLTPLASIINGITIIAIAPVITAAAAATATRTAPRSRQAPNASNKNGKDTALVSARVAEDFPQKDACQNLRNMQNLLSQPLSGVHGPEQTVQNS